jgi:DNA-binding NarL/FixJ family response regulator
MIKLIITDDHPIMIDGIRTALSGESDIIIIGEAYNGNQLLDLLESKKSDIILLDIRMPILDGIDTLKILRNKFKKIKVIMLTQFGERQFIKKCIEYGADGYLLKDCGKHELMNAIRTVNEGGTWFDIHNRLSNSINENLDDMPKLSKREVEVLQLICEELSNREIAEKLNISVDTVNTYRTRLMKKAGAKKVIGLFRWASKNRLINLDSI